jgi:CheY-like chemotaxis protein
MITACSDEISQLTQTADIKAFFVDIVILEKGAPDTIGVDIAKELRRRFPSIPVYNITSKYVHEDELDILSEATLEDVDGVLVKSYLEGKRFSAKRLRHIFEKAEEKRSSYGMRTAPDIHNVQAEDARRPNTDVVILTALDEEQDVVLKHFPSEPQDVGNRRIRLGEHAGFKFALLAMHGKGNTRAAALTMWAITQLKLASSFYWELLAA